MRKHPLKILNEENLKYRALTAFLFLFRLRVLNSGVYYIITLTRIISSKIICISLRLGVDSFTYG